MVKHKNDVIDRGKITSIKTKLLGIILPVVIVMIITLVSISYFISSSSITKVSDNLLDTSISNQYNQITAWLDDNLKSFSMLKTAIEGTKPNDEQLRLLLDQYSNYDSNYSNGIYIGDSDGNLIVGKGSNKTENDVLNSRWYKEGITRVDLDYGEQYTNSNGERVITASGIIDDNSGKIRIMAADIMLDRISIIVNSNVEMEDAQSFLIDLNNGTILSHRDRELVGTNINSYSNDLFFSGIAEKISNNDYKHTIIGEYSSAFKRIDDTNWLLVSYVPTKTILKEVTFLRNIMISISLISLILLVVLIERVVHITINPVKKLTDVIRRMADGDFTIIVEEKGNDEITLMSKSVNNLVKSMKSMIDEMANISQNLNNQAQVSSKISEQMNEASRIQANSTEELNATVDDLVKSTEEIANNAMELATFVSNTREDSDSVKAKMSETVSVSEKGRNDMEAVGHSMNNISTSINELQKGINEVGTASEEITSIIKLIGDIAEQTNLLSLNASIEAARAGEAGRGFAVVASEIGSLAKTSTDAVKEISELIESIKLLITNVINQANSSIKDINGSNDNIITSLNTFNVIYDNIQETNLLIQDIVEKVTEVENVATNVASISEEQAAGAEIILNSSEIMVNQSSSITKNSSEVSEGAKEISLTSNKLDKQIQLFKVN